MTAAHVPDVSIAEKLVDRIRAVDSDRLPDPLRRRCEEAGARVLGPRWLLDLLYGA